MIATLRSHAPLPPCASVKSRRRIAAPCWRAMMLAPTMLAPQWSHPALSLSIEHGVHSRHGRLVLLDDIGHHCKHRAAVLCAGFEDVADCK